MFGTIGDTTRGGDGRTDNAAVNYWGPDFREKQNWLPTLDDVRTIAPQLIDLATELTDLSSMC